MKVNTYLRKQIQASPLSQHAVVRPKGNKVKRVLFSSLMLTSLVDAFSILVIFLLMSASAGVESVELDKGLQLPMSSTTEALKDGVLLKVEGGRYFIDKNPVTLDQLATVLTEAKKKEAERTGKTDVALIVQADKTADYKDLSPLLEAGADVGFKHYRLAVLEDKRKQL